MPDGTAPRFEGSGFETNYAVDVDPEFPGDGTWPCANYAFNREGSIQSEFVSPWGTPLILRIKPDTQPEWVGMFPAGGLEQLSGVFATPSLRALCVVVDGLAYVVKTDEPHEGARIVLNFVRQVVAAPKWNLLLLADYTDLVALGPRGVVWRAASLTIDNLWVTGTEGAGIECKGLTLGKRDLEPTTLIVDPHTGHARSLTPPN